ncbi:MAG: hypothetical protein RSA79_02760 [Oscillospiraceae bacterium]
MQKTPVQKQQIQSQARPVKTQVPVMARERHAVVERKTAQKLSPSEALRRKFINFNK